jgi:hypothetical protein
LSDAPGFERERVAIVVNENVLTVADVAAEQPFGEFVLQLALDGSL